MKRATRSLCGYIREVIRNYDIDELRLFCCEGDPCIVRSQVRHQLRNFHGPDIVLDEALYLIRLANRCKWFRT